MNITELAIYKKMFGGTGGGTPVKGTWVFKNVLQIPAELYDKDFDIIFKSRDTMGEILTYNSFCIWADGSGLSYYGEEGGVEEAYYVENGWYEGCNTIKIIEEPTDAKFTEWLKSNAEKKEVLTGSSYTVSSADELPSNAVDGSMAIVEGEQALAGTWQFNDVVINMKPYVLRGAFFLTQTREIFNGIYADIYAEKTALYYTQTGGRVPVYENGVWLDEKYKTISIDNEEYSTPQFKEWLKSNAIQTKIQITGCWLFKDKIDYDGIDYYVNFITYDGSSGKMIHGNIYQDGDGLMYEGDYLGITVINNGEWARPEYKLIWIIADPEDSDFYSWLTANATKVIPSALYTHENGEWVYKCEVA